MGEWARDRCDTCGLPRARHLTPEQWAIVGGKVEGCPACDEMPAGACLYHAFGLPIPPPRGVALRREAT
jgi:hypothetical protein